DDRHARGAVTERGITPSFALFGKVAGAPTGRAARHDLSWHDPGLRGFRRSYREPRKTVFSCSNQDLFPFVVRYRTMNGAGHLKTTLRYLRANGLRFRSCRFFEVPYKRFEPPLMRSILLVVVEIA